MYYSDSDPWYFEVNQMLSAWNYSMGQGVTINMIDTCVDFTGHLKGKNNSVVAECPYFDINNHDINDIHGTAMASIMVSKNISLSNYENNLHNLSVIGIAPAAKINAFESIKLKTFKCITSKNEFSSYNNPLDLNKDKTCSKI